MAVIDRAVVSISDFRNNRAEDQIYSGGSVAVRERDCFPGGLLTKRGNVRAHVDNEKLASVRAPYTRHRIKQMVRVVKHDTTLIAQLRPADVTPAVSVTVTPRRD